MTYRIRLLALLLALVMVLGVLAGCVEDAGDGTESESESESVVETGSAEGTDTEATETESAGTSETEAATTTEAATEESQETSATATTEAPTETTEETTTEPKEPDTGWETLEDVKLEEEICAVTSEHCVATNWIPKVGTAREKKYCYYCGKEVYDRATPFTIYAINIEQSKYQTAVRSDKSTSGSIKFKIAEGAKIVIPTSPEYNIVASGIGLTMTGNYDGAIVGNAIYYSVDGGKTWATCPSESGVLTIALTSDMFTGDNAGNVDKAIENGVTYGVIPGYNADYIKENPDKLADVMRKIIVIEKDALSKDVADAGGHNDDPALVVSLCEHKGDRTATKSDAGVYTYKCATCGKDLGVTGTVKDSVNYFSTDLITNADLVGVQNGVVFTRINPGISKIKVSPIDTNVKLGKYVVVKYRAMGYGSLKVVWDYSGAGKKVTNTISRAETDGWEIAVVNVAGMYAAGVYTDGEWGAFTLTFECEGIVDIAYVAMASNLLDLCAIMGENVTFHHRGTSFAKTGSICNSNDGKCIAHSVKVTTKDNEDKTAKIYSYVCDACEEKLADNMTVPNTITYFTDITKIAPQNSADGKTKVSYLNDNGVTFARVEFVGSEGSAVALLPNGTYDLGRYIAIKYRVVGDSSVQFRSQIGGSSNDNMSSGGTAHTKDTWMVAVLDLSAFKGYKAKTSFYSLFYTNGKLDIAYVAISNDLADIRSLLADNEVYFYRGEGMSAFNNISGQATVDKSGKCAAECTIVDIPAVAPTCSSVGYTQGSMCCACGKIVVKPEPIDKNPNNHVIVTIPAVSESCSDAGTTEGSKCSECGKVFKEPEEVPANPNNHNVVVTATKDEAAGTITYKYMCKDCLQACHDPITVPATLAYFDASAMAKGTGITVFKNRAENGITFVHIESNGNLDSRSYAEGKIQGIKLGKYLAIKYRVTDSANDGAVKFELRFKSDTAVHTASIQNAKTDGWVIAVVDISNKSQYKLQQTNQATEDQQLWFRIFCGASIDLAYVIMSDDMNDIKSLMADGEIYYDRGEHLSDGIATEKAYNKDGTCAHGGGTATCLSKAICKYCGEQYGEIGTHNPIEIPAVPATCGAVGYTAGAKCEWCDEIYTAPQELPVDPNNHAIIMKTAAGETAGTVTYTYGCACGHVTHNSATLVDGVGFVDITKTTTSNGTVETLVDEQGRVYVKVSSNGGETTTTITVPGIKLGITAMMKYRLNGGDTPENSLAVGMTYTINGTPYALPKGLNNVVSAADLAKRHHGWVVGRINNNTPLVGGGGYGLNTAIGQPADLTITITHTDDFELYYFITDKAQDNKGTFEYVVSQGDNFYLHQNQIFGSYIDNQWRKITDAAGGVASGTGYEDSKLVNSYTPTLKQ